MRIGQHRLPSSDYGIPMYPKETDIRMTMMRIPDPSFLVGSYFPVVREALILRSSNARLTLSEKREILGMTAQGWTYISEYLKRNYEGGEGFGSRSIP